MHIGSADAFLFTVKIQQVWTEVHVFDQLFAVVDTCTFILYRGVTISQNILLYDSFVQFHGSYGNSITKFNDSICILDDFSDRQATNSLIAMTINYVKQNWNIESIHLQKLCILQNMAKSHFAW